MLLYKTLEKPKGFVGREPIRYPPREGTRITNTIDEKEEDKVLDMKDIEEAILTQNIKDDYTQYRPRGRYYYNGFQDRNYNKTYYERRPQYYNYNYAQGNHWDRQQNNRRRRARWNPGYFNVY